MFFTQQWSQVAYNKELPLKIQTVWTLASRFLTRDETISMTH